MTDVTDKILVTYLTHDPLSALLKLHRNVYGRQCSLSYSTPVERHAMMCATHNILNAKEFDICSF
jgi:hypothetical protein